MSLHTVTGKQGFPLNWIFAKRDVLPLATGHVVNAGHSQVEIQLELEVVRRSLAVLRLEL